jgi:predicted Zn finger-like uncharacterized protein
VRIDCESCNAAFTIDDKLIGDRGIRAQCPKCGHQTVVKKDAGDAGGSPFGAPAGGGGNPFAAPAGGGGNPFAAPPGGPPAGGGNPFGAPAGGAPAGGGNPFAAPPGGPPAGGGNPFAAPPAGGGGNPFAAPGGGAPAGGGGNPFAAPPAGGNPFAGPPGGAPAGGNPFGPPAGGPPAGGNPFAAPPSGGGGDPFAAPAGGGDNPFAAPAGGGGGGDPFAAPASTAAPTKDPFAAPAGGGNPFGSPPGGDGGGNPFGAPAGGGGAADPFGGGGGADDPFGGAAGGGSGDPFAAPESSNPFGSPPGGADSPFGPPGGGDPFGGGGQAEDPFAAPKVDDPFANLNAGGGGDASDPFADITGAPGVDGGDAGGPAPSSGGLWQVETSGGKSTDVSLDELRSMIRSGQVGPNDQAGPMGKAMRRVADDPILAVSLPKGTTSKVGRVKGASASGGGGGGLGRMLMILVVLGGLGGGGGYFLYTQRPDLFERTTDQGVNPFRRALPQWSLQFPNVEGTSQEHVVEGRKYLRMDTAVTYRRADEHFRRALLLDVSNPEAVAGYVEAYTYLPNVAAGADRDGLRLAFEGLDYALEADPRHPRLLRAKGALLDATGQVDKAGRELKLALKADPSDNVAKLLFARSQLDRSIDDSLRFVEEVQRQDPELKQALTIAGAAHRRLGNYKRARDYLKSRLDGDPGNVPALRELALLELDLGEPAAALRWLQRIRSAEERDIDARLLLAKVYYQYLGKNPAAEKELRQIVDEYEGAAGDLMLPVLSHYSYLLTLRGDADGAEKAARRALDLDSNFAAAHVSLARALVKKAKGNDKEALGEARKSLEEAVRLVKANPKENFHEPVVRNLLADVQVALGDEVNALRNYEQVLEYDPRYAPAYFGMAALHARAGQGARAVAQIRRALNVDPRHNASRVTLTDFPVPRTDVADYATALADLSTDGIGKSLKYSSEGVVRYHAGDRLKSKSLLNKALAADGENHPALLYVAVIELEEGDAKKASRRLKKALKTTGANHAITQLYLAEAEVALGSFKDAEKRINAVIEEDPSIARAHFVAAELMLRRGKRDAGLQQLKKIVTESPMYRPAKARLAELGA